LKGFSVGTAFTYSNKRLRLQFFTFISPQLFLRNQTVLFLGWDFIDFDVNMLNEG
jgi:hypothetical protein